MFHNNQLSDYLLPMVCVYRQLVLQTLQCLLHRLTVWVATELEEQIIIENYLPVFKVPLMISRTPQM